VVALLGMLVWRGLRTAIRARDGFGFLLAMGINCWIIFQAFINIAVITAVIPFTGIPLPFLSYGGTSLAITMVGAGILLNVSRDSALQKRPQTSDVRERRQNTGTSRRSKRPSATDRF
jgi:cell division protein FtsW